MLQLTYSFALSSLAAVCHSLSAGQMISQYFLVQTPMSWVKAREFCQRHYVDLAVLNSEEQYFTLVNATNTKKVSFWLGLKRRGVFSSWMWVSGEELVYEHWHRKNYGGQCASLEAMSEKDGKLLARYCDESHMTVCQGKCWDYLKLETCECSTTKSQTGTQSQQRSFF